MNEDENTPITGPSFQTSKIASKDDEVRKYWIRTFAASAISRDTVANSVKWATQLWDALEAEFSKTERVH